MSRDARKVIGVLVAAGAMAAIIGAVIWIFRHAPFVIG
jgi:hypothetical protein